MSKVEVWRCPVHGDFEFVDVVAPPECPECGRPLELVDVYEE